MQFLSIKIRILFISEMLQGFGLLRWVAFDFVLILLI